MSISGINNEDDDFESDFKPKKSNKSKKIKKLESSDEDADANIQVDTDE